MVTASCGSCGREWSGIGQAHCKRMGEGRGCCQHFNSTSAFDRHRVDFACLPVERFSDLIGKKNPKPRLVPISHPNGPIWATGRLDPEIAATVHGRSAAAISEGVE